MFKKRLLAFGLAGVMVMGLNMSVLAAEGDVSGTGDQDKDVTVTGTIPETYTIKIPASISASATATTPISITANLVNLNSGKRLVVKTAKSVELTGAGFSSKVIAKVTLAGAELTADATEVASFVTQTTDNTIGSLALDKIGDSSAKADIYTGDMTFNISVLAQ